MTIPEILIQRLKGLDANEYNDEQLSDLCKNIIDSFLDESKNVDQKYPNDLVSTIGTIIIHAATKNLDPSALKESLFGLNGQEYKIGKALVDTYSERFKDLVDGPLKTISWKHPQIVDIDWKLSGVMESDSEVAIKEPLAELKFTSLATNETKFEDFSFVCTKQQLQDMQWKCKEAHNLLQKMASQ